MKKQSSRIFTVHVVYIEKEQMICNRLWGYYFSYKEAEEIVLNNITNIFEDDYYNYALINEFKPGILQIPENYSFVERRHISGWYKARYLRSKKMTKVTPCEQPLPLGHVFVWG